jgi:pentatricopeptide repeat protein
MATDLIRTYIACDAPGQAVSLLERLAPSHFTVFWWNVLIRRGSCVVGFLRRCLVCTEECKDLGGGLTTTPSLLCSKLVASFRRFVVSIHAVVCANGFESNVFVCNIVVALYGRCGVLDEARRVLDDLCERGIGDVVSWNSIVAAYVQGGDARNALKMFDNMTDDRGICPDAVSIVNILPTCASVGAWLQGKEVHRFAFRSGLVEDVFVDNALVDMYAKCGMMDEANKVFDRMMVKDVVSWNAMVTGYSKIGRFEDVLALF